MSYSNRIAKGHCDTNLLDTSHLGGIGGPEQSLDVTVHVPLLELEHVALLLLR